MLDSFSVDVLELVFHYRTVKSLNGGQIDFFPVAGNDNYLRLALYVALPFGFTAVDHSRSFLFAERRKAHLLIKERQEFGQRLFRTFQCYSEVLDIQIERQ